VDTGELRAKGPFVYAGLSNEPGEFGRITARPGVWYGAVHEQSGKKSPWGYAIRAKTEKGMSFFWKRKGIWMHHVPVVIIPPRPWLYPAIMDNIDKIKNLLGTMVRKAYKESLEKGSAGG